MLTQPIVNRSPIVTPVVQSEMDQWDVQLAQQLGPSVVAEGMPVREPSQVAAPHPAIDRFHTEQLVTEMKSNKRLRHQLREEIAKLVLRHVLDDETKIGDLDSATLERIFQSVAPSLGTGLVATPETGRSTIAAEIAWSERQNSQEELQPQPRNDGSPDPLLAKRAAAKVPELEIAADPIRPVALSRLSQASATTLVHARRDVPHTTITRSTSSAFSEHGSNGSSNNGTRAKSNGVTKKN